MKGKIKMKKIRCGIVGVVGRGQVYVQPMMDYEFSEITAICDLNEEGMREYAARIGNNVAMFTSYEEMIDSGLVDLVVIGTPVPLHVSQSIYALERDIHVVCEVPAASTVEESRRLYRAAKNSNAQYMMAENVNYYKEVIIIQKLIEAGYLGEVHYAEGQYLHYNDNPFKDWRCQLYGAAYSTHNLGPMLSWFGNERIEKVCCVGSGRHRKSPDGSREERREMANVMLCKTESGRLLQVRLDSCTPTPYMLPFEVSGTKGRAIIRQNAPKSETYIHIASPDYDLTPYAEEWKSLQYYEREFLPESWNEATQKIPNSGHSRGDYVMVIEILKALHEDCQLPINIDMAMNMTLPGIMSKVSIDNGGEWVTIPKLNEE